jgi:hypothetical protein
MRAEARLGRSVELMYQTPRTNYFRSFRRKYEIVHKGRVELRLMFLTRGE